MKISYAILTHNEGECIAELLTLLTTYKRDIDEIVVVDDYSNDEKTKFILNDVKDLIKLEYRTFDGDHTQKNYLNSLDRKSTRLNSSHSQQSRMPSSA